MVGSAGFGICKQLIRNMKTSVAVFLFSLAGAWLSAQSLPIAIDSQFDDWTATAQFADGQGDGNNLDLLRFDVANDGNYLFLRLTLNDEILLTNSNDLTLFLDTDNNGLTGKAVNGIGAELELNFGDREGRFYFGNSSLPINLNSVKFHHQPTVSSGVFEMAIGRDVQLAGFPLFTGNVIRIFFRDGVAGDMMPNAGQTFTYVFDNATPPPFQPIDLQKDNSQHIRLLTWNTLQNGLDDFDRKEHFKRVIGVLQPDIITFNECWNVTSGMAATLVNEALPLGNFQSWNAVKLDQGNITVSRFPILQNWLVYPGSRLTASLIDLPDGLYSTDLLVVNAHLKCCSDGNYARQLEADAFAAFVLDAQSPGGVITLPENTPFVLSGDLNLVGWQQQLTTLLTGDIVYTGTFGPGGPLDWDGTDLLDVISLQTDQRMAYTWRSDFSDYPPSRIDFHICSNSVMQVKKAFTLQTEIMSPERLTEYGLLADDTHSASDHLPKVTDFELDNLTETTNTNRLEPGFEVWPNPISHTVYARFTWPGATELHFSLFRPDGMLVRQWEVTGMQELEADLGDLPGGIYFFSVQTEMNRKVVRVVKR